MRPGVQLRLAQPGDAMEIALMSRDLIEHGLAWSWTRTRVARSMSASFGREMKPLEANVVMNIPGDHFRMLLAGKVRRRSHFRKLMRCSAKKELKYHYGTRFYHYRWARLVMIAGNFLYHPRVFPKLKKLSGWILRSPSR